MTEQELKLEDLARMNALVEREVQKKSSADDVKRVLREIEVEKNVFLEVALTVTKYYR